MLFGRAMVMNMNMDVLAKNQLENDQVFSLGEIVVTAEKNTANLSTTVTEVSMEEIAAKGATSVAEALEFLPGVFVQNSGKGESHVSIRGFEQRQVKILIDGVPARENYFGTVDLSMLPAETISKITITKGASSVLYGSNTMGGVINIITKKGGKTPETTVTTSVGDYDTANYFLSHGNSLGNLNYWMSGGYQTSDGYRLSGDFDANDSNVGLDSDYNEDGGKRDLSNYLKKNLDMKIGYDPGQNSSVYLSFNYVDNERGIPTFYNRYWAYNSWQQWQLNLTGEHRFNDAVKVKTRLFYVKHDDGISDVSWDEDHTTSGKKWFEESYYDDASVGGEIQTAVELAQWNSLRFGLNYMEDNHKEGNYLDDDCYSVINGWSSVGWEAEEEYTAHTYTLAVEDELRPFDRLSMVIGMSYDVFEPTQTSDQPSPGKMDTLNPQAGVVFEMTESTSFHASLGKKTRFPSLKELYSDLAGGNPDLNPEETIAYELGGSHTFSKNATGELAFFYNDVTDLISTTTISDESVYINIDEATLFGVEANFNIQLSSAMNAGINYTFLETHDKSNNGRDLEGRPRHRINLTMGYRFSFGLRADLQASYNRRQFWENDDDEWEELPDYFLVNLKLTQRLRKLWKIDSELFVQASNLLDENYYETNGPEPGLNLLAGITLRL
jgi:iron complex outermembrane receptor protein/outer membrane receptor for ferrienterochelin and colicins